MNYVVNPPRGLWLLEAISCRIVHESRNTPLLVVTDEKNVNTCPAPCLFVSRGHFYACRSYCLTFLSKKFSASQVAKSVNYAQHGAQKHV